MPPRNPVVTVGLRILAGIALYFVLLALWLLAGLDRIYDGYVLVLSEKLLPALTHFPVGSSEGVGLLEIHNQAFVLIWIIALALVVKGVPWKKRVFGYASLAVVVVVLHVVGLTLQLHLALALKSQEILRVPLLLPWEMHVLKVATQVLFLASLQVAAFVALILTGFWSSGRGLAGWFGNGEEVGASARRGLPARQRRWLTVAGLSVVLAGAVCATTAWWIRERDPRHLAAHARVGDAFARQEMFAEAEKQYRAAIRGETDAGRTWMALAAVVHRQGDRAETARILDHALEEVTDPAWRARLEQARDEVAD